MEKVDILLPPTFKRSGKIKTLKQAWDDEDWLGGFNLWIVQTKPAPSIIYQKRSSRSSLAPDKLDVAAAGHYSAGEKTVDGLREVEEELGKKYSPKDLIHLGRKINLSPDTYGNMRHNICDLYMVIDNSSLKTYKLQKSEVEAICICPISELIKVHTQKNYRFYVAGIDNNRKPIKIRVSKDSFPYNWDNYHFKIALLANRLIEGEKHLIY